MAWIRYTYNTYTHKFPTISELDFYRIKAELDEYPQNNYFPVKSLSELLLECMIEFKFQIGVSFGIGILIGAFSNDEFLIMLILPFILWLIFGGFVSIVNYYSSIKGLNKFNRVLNIEFPNFDSYEKYIYFRKFEALKFLG